MIESQKQIGTELAVNAPAESADTRPVRAGEPIWNPELFRTELARRSDELLEGSPETLRKAAEQVLAHPDVAVRLTAEVHAFLARVCALSFSEWSKGQHEALARTVAFQQLLPEGTAIKDSLESRRQTVREIRQRRSDLGDNIGLLGPVDRPRAENLLALLDATDVLSPQQIALFNKYAAILKIKKELVTTIEQRKRNVKESAPEGLLKSWTEFFETLWHVSVTSSRPMAIKVFQYADPLTFIREEFRSIPAPIASACAASLVGTCMFQAERHREIPLRLVVCIAELAQYNEPVVLDFLEQMLCRSRGYGLEVSTKPSQLGTFFSQLLEQTPAFSRVLRNFIPTCGYLSTLGDKRDMFAVLLQATEAPHVPEGPSTEAPVGRSVRRSERDPVSASADMLRALCNKIVCQIPVTPADDIPLKGEFWNVEVGGQTRKIIEEECGDNFGLSDIVENGKQLDLVIRSCEIDPIDGLSIFVTTRAQWQKSALNHPEYCDWLDQKAAQWGANSAPLLSQEIGARHRVVRARLFEIAVDLIATATAPANSIYRAALDRNSEKFKANSARPERSTPGLLRVLPLGKTELVAALKELNADSSVVARFVECYRELGCFIPTDYAKSVAGV